MSPWRQPEAERRGNAGKGRVSCQPVGTVHDTGWVWRHSERLWLNVNNRRLNRKIKARRRLIPEVWRADSRLQHGRLPLPLLQLSPCCTCAPAADVDPSRHLWNVSLPPQNKSGMFGGFSENPNSRDIKCRWIRSSSGESDLSCLSGGFRSYYSAGRRHSQFRVSIQEQQIRGVRIDRIVWTKASRKSYFCYRTL